MSINCLMRAEELSWDNKAMQMLDLYHRVVENRKHNIGSV